MSRNLTPNERALLEWLLRVSTPEADDLRAQIPFTRVVEGTPALPTWLHLEVSGAAPAARKDGNVAGGVVEDSSGEGTGFLELWVKDGYLSAVEHSWVTGEMPEAFPSGDQTRYTTYADDVSGGLRRRAHVRAGRVDVFPIRGVTR